MATSKPHLVVKDNSKKIFETLQNLTKKQVFAGITQATSQDRDVVLRQQMSALKPGTKRSKRATNRFMRNEVTNAELMYVHSKGSALQGIPARPVLEPAIEAPDNRTAISNELQAAAKAALDGNQQQAETKLRRAGIAAQRAAQKWFTDPRNGWAPNKPSTIKAKGSSRPLIDSGALRKAITYVVKDSK
jgi:hypothetical protein